MSFQNSDVESATMRSHPGVKPRPTHTEELLCDDICWLESRIHQLQAAASASERKLTICYQKLLRQRRLASMDGSCPGCWQDFLC